WISLNLARVTFSNAFLTAPPKAALAPVNGADTPNVIGPSGIAGHFFDEPDVVAAPPDAAVVAAPPLAAVVVALPAALVAAAVVAALLPPLLSLPQAAASRTVAPRTAPKTRRVWLRIDTSPFPLWEWMARPPAPPRRAA